MVLYYGKHIEAAQVGSRLARVACEKCGCEYFYELARIGAGSETAPYGIGVAGATRRAKKQSQRDLQRRLAREAELVPCPKCHWINEHLVRGYRLGRYRHLAAVACVVGVGGTVVSLIAAWIIARGPPVDRGWLPYFLFGGPLLSLAVALGLMCLRTWMRNRIRPNRNFPLPPRLPTGSPPALVMAESDSKFCLAKPHDARVRDKSKWLEFQIGRHQLPLLCCTCLRACTMEHVYGIQVNTPLELSIPRCAACQQQSKQMFRRIWWIVATLMTVAEGGLVMALSLERIEFWLLLITSLLLTLALASYVASAMTAPVKTARGDPTRGVIRLRFRNTEYQAAVARHRDATVGGLVTSDRHLPN